MSGGDELKSFRREQQQARRVRRAWEAALGGRSSLPSPLSRSRQFGGVALAPASNIGGQVAGHTVTVETATIEIPEDGTTIEWETISSLPKRAGFTDFTVPSEELGIPVRGYYRLHVAFEWDTYRLGGSVSVVLAGFAVETISAPFGTRFSHVAALGVCEPGQAVTVFVDHGDSGPHDLVDARASLEFVHSPADLLAEPIMFGYDAAPTGTTSSVTITATGTINPGDLLVAFVASAEPTVTSPPEFTTLDTETPTTDERYMIQTRTAVPGDEIDSWTWTATAGGGPDMSLAVAVIVLPGPVAVDGTPDFERQAGGVDPTLSITTAEATGTLLVLAMSQDGPSSIAGFSKIMESTHVSNVGQVFTYTIHRADVAAGTHNLTVVGPTWIVAHVMGAG